jgi:hypothetical protein
MDDDGWSARRAGVVALSMVVGGALVLVVSAIVRFVRVLGVLSLLSMRVGGVIALVGLFARGGSHTRRRRGQVLCVAALVILFALVMVFAASAPDPG